jgi:hypothetical protein
LQVSEGSTGILTGGTLYEEGVLFIGVDDNRLNASMLTMLNQSLGTYQLNQLSDFGFVIMTFPLILHFTDHSLVLALWHFVSFVSRCILGAIHELNLTSLFLNSTVRAITLTSGNADGVDDDIDLAIDNLLLLFTHNFAPAIPAFLRAFISEPGRLLLDETIADFLKYNASNMTCATPVMTADKSSFNVNSSTLVSHLFFVFTLVSFLSSSSVAFMCSLLHFHSGVLCCCWHDSSSRFERSVVQCSSQEESLFEPG